VPPKLLQILSEERLRIVCRSVLVWLLVVSLADLPALAANRALGFVVDAQSSQIDGIEATGGATLFPGDALSTAADGALRVQFGADGIYMGSSSALTLAGEKDGLTAALSAGTVEFEAPRGAGIAVSADDVLIRPNRPQATQAQITVVSNDQLKIATVSGPLALELDGELYTLAPGKTYGVKIVADDDQEKGTEQQPARKRRRKLLFWLFFGGAAAAVTAILLLHRSSPQHESQYQP
jgi:hypothetical protein